MKDSVWIRYAVAAGCVALIAGAAQAGSVGAAAASLAAMQEGDKADSKAVKPCQEEIRKKAKAEHSGMDITFESVETSQIAADVVGVKGKFRLGKGGDSTTMNYNCRVDVKEMKVKRAEYGKEN